MCLVLHLPPGDGQILLCKPPQALRGWLTGGQEAPSAVGRAPTSPPAGREPAHGVKGRDTWDGSLQKPPEETAEES